MSRYALPEALTTILRVMNEPTTVKPSGHRIGTILLRLVVPLWILLGAGVKLWERNPQLLPKPVTDVTDFIFVRGLGLNREDYLGPAMRFMIAVEIMAALLMVVGPVQAARSLAIALMTMFCVILGLLIASGAASCGCFGASGPSPEWMLAIDLTLLIGLCVLRPRGRRLPPAELGRKLGSVMFVPVLLGIGIAFGVPDRAAVTLEVVDTATPAVTPPVVTTPVVATPVVTATTAWPPMPATAKPWYAPEFESWKASDWMPKKSCS
jgi:hypothetical protein